MLTQTLISKLIEFGISQHVDRCPYSKWLCYLAIYTALITN